MPCRAAVLRAGGCEPLAAAARPVPASTPEPRYVTRRRDGWRGVGVCVLGGGRRYSIPVQTLLTAYEERADKQSKRACMLPLVSARVHVASACACCPWCQRACMLPARVHGAPGASARASCQRACMVPLVPARVLGRSSSSCAGALLVCVLGRSCARLAGRPTCGAHAEARSVPLRQMLTKTCARGMQRRLSTTTGQSHHALIVSGTHTR